MKKILIKIIISVVLFFSIETNKGNASKMLEIMVIGKTQVERVCYVTFEIINNTDKELNKLYIQLNAINFYGYLIGSGIIKIKNINKNQPYTYVSTLEITDTKDYKCKDISYLELMLKNCVFNNFKNMEFCQNRIKLKNNDDNFRIKFGELDFYQKNSNQTEVYIDELKIKVVSLNSQTAKAYSITKNQRGLIITGITNSEKIFEKGDILIEIDMTPLTDPTSLKTMLNEKLLNKN